MNHGLMYLAATFYAFAFFHLFFLHLKPKTSTINSQFKLDWTRKREKQQRYIEHNKEPRKNEFEIISIFLSDG